MVMNSDGSVYELVGLVEGVRRSADEQDESVLDGRFARNSAVIGQERGQRRRRDDVSGASSVEQGQVDDDDGPGAVAGAADEDAAVDHRRPLGLQRCHR